MKPIQQNKYNAEARGWVQGRDVVVPALGADCDPSLWLSLVDGLQIVKTESLAFSIVSKETFIMGGTHPEEFV